MSPLQAYILIRIIQEHNIRPVVLYISHFNNERTKHYANRLSNLSNEFHYFDIQGKRTWQVLPKLLTLIKTLKPKTHHVLLASFNAFYPIVIVNKLAPKQIGLFDDGSFSILNDAERAPLMQCIPNGWIKKYFYSMLGVHDLCHDIQFKANYIITIFQNDQRLVSQHKSIPLTFAPQLKSSQALSCITDDIVLFVGDVCTELTNKDRALHARLIAMEDIHYYLPHPRNIINKTERNKVLSIHTVAEEFIANLLQAGFHVSLVSMSSTVLFSAPQNPRLCRYMVIGDKPQYQSLLDKAEKFGIKVVNETHLEELLRNTRLSDIKVQSIRKTPT